MCFHLQHYISGSLKTDGNDYQNHVSWQKKMGGLNPYCKDLPRLLYHFLALTDRTADVLGVNYLITILYTDWVCALPWLYRPYWVCIISSHGGLWLLLSWEVVKLTLPPQVVVSPLCSSDTTTLLFLFSASRQFPYQL